MSDKLNKIIDTVTSSEIKVVSFDIFDTLLVRPVVQPTDLFKIIAKRIGYPDNQFLTMRKLAEREARKKRPFNIEDICLDDIYSQFSEMYFIDKQTSEDIKRIELDVEEKFLYPRKSIQYVYNKALEAGKEVIITSDMYLPKSFLERVLNKNGYYGYSNFYLSSDCKVSKGTGNLFSKILKYYGEKGISPEEIIHIGDNEFADVKQPKKLGIRTGFVPRAIEVFKSKSEFNILQAGFHPSMDNCFLIGFLANYLFDDPYEPYASYSVLNGKVENLGIIFAPLLLAFSKWMIEDAVEEKVERLILTLRDGYIPSKVIELLRPYYSNIPEIESIYLSRAIRYPYYSKFELGLIRSIADIPVDKNMSVENFIKHRLLVDSEEEKQEILHIFLKNGYVSKTSKIGNEEKYFPFLASLETFFKKNAEKRIKTIDEYCKDILNSSQKLAVFDVGYRGSVSRFLTDNFGVENLGYHIFATPLLNINSRKYNLKSFIHYGLDVPKNTMIIHALIEDIISIQEGSAVDIIKEHGSFKIIREMGGNESLKITKIQENLLKFCKEFINLFGEDIKQLEFDRYNYFNFLVRFLNRPTKIDAAAIGNLNFYDSSFITNSERNMYKLWHIKHFPNVGKAIKEYGVNDKKELIKSILKKIHLFNIAKRVYNSIKVLRFKGFTIYSKKEDLVINTEREIKNSLEDIAQSELLLQANNILIVGDMVSFDKGSCNYLNQLSQRLHGFNFVLLSEATWLDRERTNNKIKFPFFIVPNMFGKNQYTKNNKIKVTSEMEKLLAEKDYLKWASDNWKNRHPNMDKNYPEVLAYYAFEYYTKVFEILKPRCMIMWNAFHALHHIIRGICKEKGIPVIYMEFGSLPGTFALERLGQMGESYPAQYYEEFRNQYVSEIEIQNAETIWSYLKKSGLNRNIQPINGNFNSLRKRLKPDRPIILYTAQNDYESGLCPYTEHSRKYHSPAYKSSYEAAEHLATLALKNDWNLLYKPHPIMSQLGLAKDIPKGAILVDGFNINDLIDFADLTVTILSQCGYISLIREKPTLMLGYTQLKGKGCSYEAFSKEDTEETIIKALRNGMTKEMKINFKKHIAQMLKYYLYDDYLEREIRYGKDIDDAVKMIKDSIL